MKRLLALVTILALTAAPLATRLEAAPAPATGLAVPVTGTGTAGTLNGTFTLLRFANVGGSVVAQGVLTGTITNATGQVTSIVQNVTATLASGSTASCPILHLVLGPIDLNLLGLHVTTNQIVIDITAESGPGNLLGNLLCAVANLLNGGGSANAIANLLNQVLAILQGL
jgi:hypothetical protein